MKPILGALIISMLSYIHPATAKVVDKIVAIVNEDVVTMSDVEKFKKRLASGGLVDDALLRLSDSALLLKDKNLLLSHRFWQLFLERF